MTLRHPAGRGKPIRLPRLVPRSQKPFAKENWYAPHNSLFSIEFQEHFQACYTPRGHSRYFDLWFWNGLPEVEAEIPHYAAGVGGVGTVMAPLNSLHQR